MPTKTFTIVVPVPTNPIPKMNAARKSFQRSILAEVMVAKYNRGDLAGAFKTHNKIKKLY